MRKTVPSGNNQEGLEAQLLTYLHDLRGRSRSSPRLRMLTGSQHTTNRPSVATSTRLRLMCRRFSLIRLQLHMKDQIQLNCFKVLI